MMKDCLIALDIGGTKTHLVIEDREQNRIHDIMVSSRNWDAEPASHGANWIAKLLQEHQPAGYQVAAIAVGAQGINSAQTADELKSELLLQGISAHIYNDAALIVPAAGFVQGIGIIAGTGAIGVSTNAEGAPLATGGWGCVIGDEGGAASLVREATRAALRANDEGLADDGLLSALLKGFNVSNAERLTRCVNDVPTAENWAPHCIVVFEAAEQGSALAQAVIHEGADYLTQLVEQLLKRGAVGSNIVVAGSVIVHQPRLFSAFEASVKRHFSNMNVHVLHKAPVEGAVFLARGALRTRG